MFVARPTLHNVYGVLFEIAAMRQTFAELRTDLPATDARRFEVNLDHLEVLALGVVDTLESQGHVTAH